MYKRLRQARKAKESAQKNLEQVTRHVGFKKIGFNGQRMAAISAAAVILS
jgi:hypothetical protein